MVLERSEESVEEAQEEFAERALPGRTTPGRWVGTQLRHDCADSSQVAGIRSRDCQVPMALHADGLERDCSQISGVLTVAAAIVVNRPHQQHPIVPINGSTPPMQLASEFSCRRGGVALQHRHQASGVRSCPALA